VASEPTLLNSPIRHAMVLAAAAAVAVVPAGALAGLISGDVRAAGLATTIVGLSWLPGLAPVLLGSRTVPSRFGQMVLFGTLGHTLATLGLALLVTRTTDVPRQALMSGVVAGAFVLLAAQVGYAVWVLRGATFQNRPPADGTERGRTG
jgi:hypothetical protein